MNKLRGSEQKVDLRGDHADIKAGVIGMDIAPAIFGTGLGQESGVVLDQQNSIQLKLLIRSEEPGGGDLAPTGDENVG